MKTLYLMCCLVALSFNTLAQHTEFSVFANTGLASFRGKAAASQTNMHAYTGTTAPAASTTGSSTDTHYGTRPGISYGGGLQLQRVKASGFVIGLQGGVDVLRSHIAIKGVYYSPSPATSAPATREGATGRSTIQNTSFNLNPYLGTRWRKGHYAIDLTLGTDLGYVIRLKEKGEATTDSGLQFASDWTFPHPHVLDIRPRAGIAVYKNSYGASISYAHGLGSYLRTLVDPSERAVYVNVLRIGAHYRL